MSVGRTTWSARDAATHDRELIVELGEELGPVGPYVHTVLSDLAQQQRAGGFIRSGFRSLARKTFVEPDQARRVVEYAGRIGALDELEIDDDGRRFTCRVSGWDADQRRGRDAWKKQAKRTDGDEGGQKGTEGDTGGQPAENPDKPLGDRRGQKGTCPPDRTYLTRPDQNSSVEPERLDEAKERMKAGPDVERLALLLAELITSRDPKAKVAPESPRWLRDMRLLIADREGDVDEVERILRWSQHDQFWQANILSPGKLRQQFTALRQRATPSAAPPANVPFDAVIAAAERREREEEQRRAERASA